MTRLKLSAVVLTLALGTTMSAAAKDHDRHERRERHEQHVREQHHERERWAREHRENRQVELARERRHREDMRRWDREHHRHPVAVKHHEPQRKGWDEGRKTGWHGQTAPPGGQAHENHHYDRRVTTPANQQGMVRRQPDNHVAQAAR
jgi:hypothetical protein